MEEEEEEDHLGGGFLDDGDTNTDSEDDTPPPNPYLPMPGSSKTKGKYFIYFFLFNIFKYK